MLGQKITMTKSNFSSKTIFGKKSKQRIYHAIIHDYSSAHYIKKDHVKFESEKSYELCINQA